MRIQINESGEWFVPMVGQQDVQRCRSCGKKLMLVRTIRGRRMPLEVETAHEGYGPGDWSIGDDGTCRPGMPLFDRYFIRPHWENCPGADQWREWWEKG